MEKAQFRVLIPADIDFLVRAIAVLRQERSPGDVAAEALALWLKQPENAALIKQHNLIDALQRAGIQSSLFDET